MSLRRVIREEISDFDFDWAGEIQGDDFHIGTRFRHKGESYDYWSWDVWEITSIDPEGYVGIKKVSDKGREIPEDSQNTRNNIPYDRFKEAYDSGSFENESVRNDIDMMVYPGAKFIIEEAWWEGEKDGIRHPREEGKIVLEITEVNEWGDSKYKVIESELPVGEPVGTEDEVEIDKIRNFIADGWWKPYGGSLNEDFDWAEGLPETVTTESDIQHFLNRPMYNIDLSTGEPVAEDEGKVVDLKYWIELNGEEPEAYNVCWNEYTSIERNARSHSEGMDIIKVCTRFRASTIVRMFKQGQLVFIDEELDEQVIKEDFDWVKQVPEIEFGDKFDEEDLDGRIFFEDNFTKVRYELDFEDFNDMVNDGYEDWYFRDLVLYNGTYEDEGDDSWFDDDEINYLPNYLSQDQISRLMEVLKRSAKLFNLKGDTALDGGADGPLQTIINDNFWDAEPYIGKNLYRGRDDWGTLTSNFMYYISKYVNINRWKSLNSHYLSELKSNNLEVDGSVYNETVSITVPFPYKTIKWDWRWNDNFGRRDNFPVEGDSIINLTEILTKGVDSVLNKGWSDYWFEDFDTTGVAEELRPDFDRFIENIEEALNEKGG